MADDKSGLRAGAPRAAHPRRVLIICAANTARSIMAEHMMRRELGSRRAGGLIEVRSAGIAPYARDGALVSLDTRMTLKSIGIDIGEEATSTDLKRHPELLEAADLVIAMTTQQESELRERFPVVAERPVFTLRALAGEAGDIDDPFEQGHEVFDVCRDEIGRLIPIVVDRLLGDSEAASGESH
ncbi:MAG: low molecular weight protein arginine phosphatase [Candidatus Binataceae bacterium]